MTAHEASSRTTKIGFPSRGARLSSAGEVVASRPAREASQAMRARW